MISVDLALRRGTFHLQTSWKSDHQSIGIFGPSGSGKTTLLYALAGLVKPDRGHIQLETETWFNSQKQVNLSPQDRDIGFVFQDARLFPHWSVRQNLRASNPDPKSLRISLHEIVSLFELDGLLHRQVGDLSGGEVKRVALGRALLRQPKLLILDEPLTGLDAGLRRKIMGYLLSLRSLKIPLIYVSHTFSDLLSLTDWVVFLEKGRVIKQAPPRDALEFVGGQNSIETTLPGRVLEHDSTGSRVACAGLTLWAPRAPVPPGAEVHVTIKAEDCVLAPQRPLQTSARNCFQARIERIVQGDVRSLLELNAGGALFWAELTPRSVQELQLIAGKTVYVLLKVRSLRTV